MTPRASATIVAVILAIAGCRSVALPANTHDTMAPRVEPPQAGRGNVVGIVADSASGYPVVGADVYFTRDSVIGTGAARPRTDLSRARTDNKGGFALRNVPPGSYTLAFSDLDHFPMRQIVVVRAGLTHSLVLRPRRRGQP